ncbi:MAG: symmetrical bis(5'-nucleosyl)-tetraphosphatase [Deltaproteobacteria bacterium]|nr:symmetrical bis(5'-nucleosyl)-tetraphosphatase [Deltaproteobacteria bacterium]
MATYAIGDIQGCYKTFRRLLKRFKFDSKKDQLFLAGDLISRGTQSLDVLRFVQDLREKAVCVLGNHEVHLLALYHGVKAREDKTKTLWPILEARDCNDLIAMLKSWPLMHVSKKNVLVHAGVLPAWRVQDARREAGAIERILRGPKVEIFLEKLYSGEKPTRWRESLTGFERHALALHSFVHMRLCRGANTIVWGFTGEPQGAPKGAKPWYMIKNRMNNDHQILFGHWSALGLRVFANCVALDSGCIWGRTLSAYRIEDGAIFVEPSAER